ncbi:MAG: lytic murein transglycosylase [Parcubacteria group bacterium]|nr:lytic murein transglycosylase [Parcubacteria group bacterium]
MASRLRPRNLLDIKSKKFDPFRVIPRRINLHASAPSLAVPLTKIAASAAICAAAVFLLFGSVSAPLRQSVYGAGNDIEAKRAELEAQLKEYEDQIDQLNGQIEGYRRQGQTLQSEIDRLNARVSKLNLQIKAVTLSLRQLDKEISITQLKIEDAGENITQRKETLAKLLQNLYENDAVNVMEMMLANPKLSDFFGNFNNLMAVQDGVRTALEDIVVLHDELIQQNEALSSQRDDAAALKAYQDAQRNAIQQTRSEKDQLLMTTKGEETRYQQILQDKQKTAAEIRKQIFRLFGGGELSFDEAYNLARVAERATGVRAALVMAVLDQESKLGKNVGQCSPESAMHPTRDLPKFKQIINELKANNELTPDPLLVSCPIRAHGSYGGAMGPAQFIASTWLLYKDAIAQVTGNNPPNPWRNADAFVATALYLKNSSNASSCTNYARDNQNVLPYQFLLERCAAAQYYAGGSWFRFRFVYGDPVLDKADQFQRDIDVLNSGVSSL